MLDFSHCRNVWVPDDSEAGGFWSPPPPHVKYGVEQILQNPYFLLADDMGGMKTAQTIIAAQFLHEMDVIDRVIVVAPSSVRSKVWFDEDLGQLKEQVWQDKRNLVTEYHQRIRNWSHGPPEEKELRWIITNYEFVRGEHLQLLFEYCTPRTMLVLDESSSVKSYSSKQTNACMLLRWQSKKNKKGEDRPILGMPRCGRILLLNGTPVADSPIDMFSQGNFLHPSILDCQFITLFKARYAVQKPVMRHDGTPMVDKWNKPILTIKSGAQGWTNLSDLQQRFAPYILRREAKDLGIDFALPPVGFEVRLTEFTWRIYKKMRDEMVVWLETDIVATSHTVAIKVLRLAQITSGFLGGVEAANIQPVDAELIESIDLPGSFLDGLRLQPEGAAALQKQTEYFNTVIESFPLATEIGREKLDFALKWHAELLERYPDLKLVTWCRFVPELRRYLSEVKRTFNHPVAAACGEVVAGGRNVKEEREIAVRLLHPKTAPTGAVTVGATQGTGAMGLNFTACHTVLDMSYDFSPWKKKQGDSRFNRPGQTRPVSFFYLIAVGPKGQKTIDHHIMLTRLGKANINDWTTAAWVKALQEE